MQVPFRCQPFDVAGKVAIAQKAGGRLPEYFGFVVMVCRHGGQNWNAKFKTLGQSGAIPYFCPIKKDPMNHLAHCFLSFGDEDVLLGNFIGDFVKGHNWEKYPRAVQRGILLHRSIDSFTDHHPLTDQSITRIRPVAGRYSPPFVDILYDHLLAIHWQKHTAVPFEQFAQTTYQQLENRAAEMPAILQDRLPKMLAGQFLHGYTHREGLEWVLQRFSQRISGPMDAKALGDAFFREIDAFSADFNGFFPELLAHAQEFLIQNR